MERNFKELLNHVKTFIFDVDGVLSDGSVVLLPGEEPLRNMYVKDAYAIQLAMRKGYRVAVVTGGTSEPVRKRMQGLGVEDVYLGCRDKIEALEDMLAIYDPREDEMLYMGDDLPDFEIMQRVGVACAPSDAAPDIRAIAHYVSQRPGGRGCVRDVIEQTLRVQGRWMEEGDLHW